MSYIDSYEHEYIGSLGYLPIYHPLQEIEGDDWGGYDFSASPGDLILGGGSGEHPGLVVHKLESSAAKFLYDQLTEEEEESLAKSDKEYLLNLCYADDVLEFCDWTVRQYANLTAMAASEAFGSPLEEDEAVEDWLRKSLGELVYYSLPELNPEHEKLAAMFSRFSIDATMHNVLCVPPGYPPCGGRRTTDGESTWGYHRWDVAR